MIRKDIIVMVKGTSLSLIIVSAICAVCLPLFPQYVWNESLERNLPKAGSYHWETREGFAVTRFGPYGTIGMSSIKEAASKIILWGDSHVEAYQVWDTQKMHMVLNQMLKNRRAENDRQVLAVGASGAMVADYICWIPIYEKFFSKIQKHLILITSHTELLPDQKDAQISQFLSKPDLHIVAKRENQASVAGRMLMDIVHDFHFQALFLAKDKLSVFFNFNKMTFAPWRESAHAGQESLKGDSTKAAHGFQEDAYRYIANRLNKATQKKIVILYAPRIFSIERGKLSVGKSPGEFEVVRRIFESKGIRCINLSNDFRELYRNEGKFPRGLTNGRPAEGHFNAVGHRTIAGAIYRRVFNKKRLTEIRRDKV